MSDAAKTLGQSLPTGGTLTDLYVVPGATSAVLSTLVICNQGTVDDKVRVAVAVAGAADTAKQYLYYDLAVAAKDTFAATLGLTLAATDVLRVYSLGGQCSFNIFGAELT